ncbi:hypothetical protein ABZU75_44615, partial [Streptosporangium sp. NPDC005286]|uniref:hypothetical protein n=1 Tax=Streptosporangium sp. NPDC005286 TaxID=3154463 RepID=UPI00339DE8FA
MSEPLHITENTGARTPRASRRVAVTALAATLLAGAAAHPRGDPGCGGRERPAAHAPTPPP